VLDLGGPVEAVAFSPDGRLLAAGDAQDPVGARVWDLRTGAVRFTCAAGLPVRALAFTPDGAALLTGALATGDVQRWETATGQRQGNGVRVGGHVESLAVLPGGRVLAAATELAPKRLRLWALDPDQPPRALEAGAEEVRPVALSPDGSWVAVGCLDQTVRVGRPSVAGPWRTLMPGGRVTAVAFGPDGSLAVATDQAVLLWDSATGERRAALPHSRGEVHGLAFSPDGRTLAVANGFRREWGSVTLWDVPGRAVVRTLPEVPALVRAVAFSPDGAALAAGDWTGAVRLWDVSDRK
jgi:WD40 repeat protein